MGLLNTLFDGWQPWRGRDAAQPERRAGRRPHGRDDALRALPPAGARRFFIGPGVEVYEGMIVGEHNRPNDTT